jgi:hypothetical protein
LKKKFQINYFRKFVFSARGRSFARSLARRLHFRKKPVISPIRIAVVISPDFYTEIGTLVGNTLKTVAQRWHCIACRVFAFFFELDLKINISLFTNYEINVLV